MDSNPKNLGNQDQTKQPGAALLQPWQFPNGVITPLMLAATPTIAEGDQYYTDTNGKFSRLAIGTTGQILTVSGGIPSWQAPATPATPTINTANIADGAVINRKMKLDQIQVVTSTTDMFTGSTSYTAHSGLTLTFTPAVASNLLVLLQLNNYNGAGTGINSFVIELDTVIQGNDPLITRYAVGGDSTDTTAAMTQFAFLWITGVSSASHTIQVYGKSNAGGTVHTTYGSLTVIPFSQ